MEKVYTEEELMAGYAEMYDLNSQISEESFGVEVEAEFITYKNL